MGSAVPDLNLLMDGSRTSAQAYWEWKSNVGGQGSPHILVFVPFSMVELLRYEHRMLTTTTELQIASKGQ